MDIRLWNCRQSRQFFLFFGCKREKHPKINAYVAWLDRNARRDRYTTVPCRASCYTMERTRNWQRHCRVNNWNHEMDTSVGVIYMNVWYVVACSKSEMRPLNVFSPLRLYLLGFYTGAFFVGTYKGHMENIILWNRRKKIIFSYYNVSYIRILFKW